MIEKNKYEIVIGLEVHVHLKTRTKLFCRCRNKFGSDQNTNICPVCTGQPGALPVTNKKAIEQSVRAGIALNCRINNKSVFARKQYFYPDLPKNYQISQYELPLAENGSIKIKNKIIAITRAHLEEDAGKLIHIQDHSMVDYNRTGTPLLEIVSEPEISSPEEAGEYLKTIRQILKYTEISDCDMEKGSLRCDANLSLREYGSNELGVKTEIKNMNSFKAVVKALEYEAIRQSKVLSEGGEVFQETRLWDEENSVTRSMRFKEEAHDYRYLPEPDLPVLYIDDNMIKVIRAGLPEMPEDRKTRYMDEYKLSQFDAGVLTQEKIVADFFETTINNFNAHDAGLIKKVIAWITTELLGKLNAENISFEDQPIESRNLARLIELIEEGTISGKMAKEIFGVMWKLKMSPEDIIKQRGLKQITSDDEINDLCIKVIDENKDIVQKFIDGKEGVLGALVGIVMKDTKGQANPKLVNEKLRDVIQKKYN